jgi:hypothetical protein
MSQRKAIISMGHKRSILCNTIYNYVTFKGLVILLTKRVSDDFFAMLTLVSVVRVLLVQ